MTNCQTPDSYGFAQLLIEKLPVRYVAERRTWYAYNGKYWEPHIEPAAGIIGHTVIEIASALRDALPEPPDKEDPKYGEWAVQAKLSKLAGDRRSIDSIINTAAALPGITVKPEVFDAHDYLFNTQDGTYDLRAGTHRDHRPEDMLTQMSPVRGGLNATASPLFDELALHLMDGDVEMAESLKDALSLALIGSNVFQVSPWLCGQSGAGKDMIISAVFAAMGEDYAGEGARGLIQDSQHHHTEETASLRNKRAVRLTELKRRIDSELFKQLVSATNLSVRANYARQEIIRNTWTIFLTTNDYPEVSEVDEGMSRRIWIFPVTGKRLSADEVERYLEGFPAEYDAIAWQLLYRASRMYGRSMPEMHPESLAARERYREDSDDVLQLLADCNWHADADAQTERTELRTTYMKRGGRLGRNAFYDRVTAITGCPASPNRKYFDGLYVAWPAW